MVINQKVTGTAKSMPIGLLYGWIAEIGISSLCCFILSAMIIRGTIQWNGVGYVIIGILIAASYVGALVSFHFIKRRRLLVCGLSGTLFLCTLVCASVLLFNSDFSSLGVSCALVLCGCMLEIVLGKQNAVRSYKKKKKTRR